MHASLAAAGRATHLRIIAVAIAASAAVLTVGLTARPPADTVSVHAPLLASLDRPAIR